MNLREVLETDREMLRRWRNLPEISRYMYTDHEIGPEEHALWFTEAMSDPSRRYWIILLDEQPVGLVNIYNIDRDNARAKWAFYLADPSVRGRGVGSYVEFTMLQYVFNDLGLHKLACEVLATNPDVVAMHQKFGFQVDGILRDEIRRNESFVDVVCLSIMEDEWITVEPSVRDRLSERGLI